MKLALLPLAKSWQLGPIPTTGIISMPATVPSGWPSGSQHPFQALVGPWGGGGDAVDEFIDLIGGVIGPAKTTPQPQL